MLQFTANNTMLYLDNGIINDSRRIDNSQIKLLFCFGLITFLRPYPVSVFDLAKK